MSVDKYEVCPFEEVASTIHQVPYTEVLPKVYVAERWEVVHDE